MAPARRTKKATAPEPMTDDEFSSLVRDEVRDAVDYIDETLGPLREKATDYYLGRPFKADDGGSEPLEDKAGQSNVVSTDVRDTVTALLPQIMRVFMSSEHLVEFRPQGPEDVAQAEQTTDYAHHVFFKDNPGYLTLHSAIKDAMIRKTGVVKYWAEEAAHIGEEDYAGLDDAQFVALASDPDVEILDHTPRPAPEEILHDLRIRRARVETKLRVEAIPPEEFVWSRRARSCADAVLVAHRATRRVSDLIALGFEWDDIEPVIGEADELDTNIEAAARRIDNETRTDTDSADPAMREVLVVDGFIRADKDGDGIAELRHFIAIGNQYKIVEDEVVEEGGFAVFQVDPEPHEFAGQSVADKTMDLQRVKSALWRQTLNNLYLTNNPAMVAVEGQVNYDDLTSDELGRIIRARAPGMVQPLDVPFVAQGSFPMFAYLDEVNERRTGYSKAAAGMDADALQSTTRAAVTATVSAAQGQVELLARNLAETGLVPLFRGLMRLARRVQDKARMVRLRGAWVQVDPRTWTADLDCEVATALGRGDVDQRMGALAMIATKQEQLLMQLGPGNPVAGLAEYRATLAKWTELAGYRDPTPFFKPVPPEIDAMMAQQAAQQPNPEVLKAQAEAQREQTKLQARIALEETQAQADMATAQQKAQLEMQLEREKAQLRFQLMREEAALQAELDAMKEMRAAQRDQQAAAMAPPPAAPAAPPVALTVDANDAVVATVAGQLGPLAEALTRMAEAQVQATNALTAAIMAPTMALRGEDGRIAGSQKVLQ